MTDQPVDENTVNRINNYKMLLDEARCKLNLKLSENGRGRSHSYHLLILTGATLTLLAGTLEVLNLTQLINFNDMLTFERSLGEITKYATLIFITMLTLFISVACCITSLLLTRTLNDKTPIHIENTLQNKYTTLELYEKILNDYSDILEKNDALNSNTQKLIRASLILYGVSLFTSCLIIIDSAFK